MVCNTYTLIRIHKEDHACYNECTVNRLRPKIYIFDDDRCTTSKLTCFFDHGDVWMGGIGICQDRPLHIHNIIRGIGGRDEDAHTHGLDRCTVGRRWISETLS